MVSSSVLPAERFMAVRVSIDGNEHQSGHVRGISLAACRDMERFPAGVHRDAQTGVPYVWTYALDDKQVDEKRDAGKW